MTSKIGTILKEDIKDIREATRRIRERHKAYRKKRREKIGISRR